MSSFSHLILTKFNSRSFPDTKPGCEPAWLEKRFCLFEKYCLPSVRHQTNQDFTWIIFLDVDTPSVYKKRISALAHGCPQMVPLYIGFPLPYGEFPDEARCQVRKYIPATCRFLITTWLDNDDAICKDYVHMVQDCFHEQQCETVNFITGYQLCNGKVYVDIEFAGHFISLIERYDPDSFKTVICRPHKQLHEVCRTARKIICEPSWLEVVHETNYMNEFRKGFRVPASTIMNRLSIEVNLNELNESRLEIILDQLRFMLLLPYYLLRRLFLRIRDCQMAEVWKSRFEYRRNPPRSRS